MLESFTQQLYAISFPPTFAGVDSIPAFIKVVYDTSLLIVGLSIFIQFSRAGVKILLAAGNASTLGEAKTMITNAIVGAILLLSAVITLNTVNPDLTANRFSYLFTQSREEHCDVYITDCLKPTNDQEETLQGINVNWGGNDVSGITKGALQELARLSLGCDAIARRRPGTHFRDSVCSVKILSYKKTTGGETIEIDNESKTHSDPLDDIHGYIRSTNPKLISKSDIRVDPLRSVYEIVKSGVTYTYHIEEDCHDEVKYDGHGCKTTSVTLRVRS